MSSKITQGTTVTLGAVPNKTVSNIEPTNLGNVTGNPFVVDATNSTKFYGLLTGNTHLAIEHLAPSPNGILNPRNIELQLQQDATGGRTLAWDGAGGGTITGLQASFLNMPTEPNSMVTFSIQAKANGDGVIVNVEVQGPTIP